VRLGRDLSAYFNKLRKRKNLKRLRNKKSTGSSPTSRSSMQRSEADIDASRTMKITQMIPLGRRRPDALQRFTCAA
jgi:hypothetical protein